MSKVLFIGPRFYNYHEVITQAFRDRGFEVDYFDDRPGTSFFTKALIRVNKRFLKRKIVRYFNTILEKVKQEQYDIVFVLYGQSFTKGMMEELKATLPKTTKFIFYMFDPLSSMPDRLDFASVFDVKFTFDYQDSKNNPEFKLLPLFYSKLPVTDSKIKYDACFIGTMMPGKYESVNKIIKELKTQGLSVFDFEYLQSKLVGIYYKIFKKEFRKAKLKEFVYKRMTNEQANEIINSSKYVIDCPKKGQTGLTIRTFEALGAEKKLITTNETVKNYDFYRPENIYIFDGKSIDFNDEFFKTEYVRLDNATYEKYSIEHWLNTLLS